MIGITERAKEALLDLRVSTPIDDPQVALRLATGDEGSLELFPDSCRAGDHVLEHQGAKLLLLDQEVSDALTGATIDCEPTGEGLRLVIETADQRNGPGLS
jgi:Fe-S cluster assembly iron-binding protein IscA